MSLCIPPPTHISRTSFHSLGFDDTVPQENQIPDMDGYMNGYESNSSDTCSSSPQTNQNVTPLTNGAGASHLPDVPRDSTPVPVAICGMGMRLPGGIHNDRDLYDFLINKGDARSTIGEDRYNLDGYYNAHGKHGTISTRYGYFINDVELSKFDLSMFTLTAAEAEQVDPNHRLALEVVREAFESAGEANWRGKNIGTYVGMFSEDWQELQHKDAQEYNPYRVLGGLDFALPNRIS